MNRRGMTSRFFTTFQPFQSSAVQSKAEILRSRIIFAKISCLGDHSIADLKISAIVLLWRLIFRPHTQIRTVLLFCSAVDGPLWSSSSGSPKMSDDDASMDDEYEVVEYTVVCSQAFCDFGVRRKISMQKLLVIRKLTNLCCWAMLGMVTFYFPLASC